MTIAYKLVRWVGPERRSLQHRRLGGGCSCVYAVDVKTLPSIPGSKLFAFDTEDAARYEVECRFSPTAVSLVEAWRCEVELSSLMLDKIIPPVSTHKHLFWRNIVNDMGLEFGDAMDLPKGTLLCDSITLLERIDL